MKIEGKLYGEKELLHALKALPVKLQNKALRTGVTKAARLVVKAAKQTVVKDSGLLKRSLGHRVWMSRDGMVIGATIGPRKGMGGLVEKKQSKKRGKYMKAVGKKDITSGKAAMRAESMEYRDPTKYAHLVERGTKHTAPRAFLRRAMSASSDVALGVMRAEVQKAINKLNAG